MRVCSIMLVMTDGEGVCVELCPVPFKCLLSVAVEEM